MGKIRILVVEDHQIVLAALKSLFEKTEEIDVLAYAMDGQEALDKVLELQPDLVLMDIGLPELDGIEVTRRIKSALPATRVLILTAYENDDFLFASLAAGADGYCLKTTGLKDLRVAIHAISQGAGWLDPLIARRVLASAKQPAPKVSKYGLSSRELEVLELLVQGASNKEIAETLLISVETVKTHVRHILEKLMVADRTQAALKAVEEHF